MNFKYATLFVNPETKAIEHYGFTETAATLATLRELFDEFVYDRIIGCNDEDYADILEVHIVDYDLLIEHHPELAADFLSNEEK